MEILTIGSNSGQFEILVRERTKIVGETVLPTQGSGMKILARAVGRRKEAVAQVKLVVGSGQFYINNKPAQAYLQNSSCSLICVKSPLVAALSLDPLISDLENSLLEAPIFTDGQEIPAEKVELMPNSADPVFTWAKIQGEIDIIVKVKGGGLIGQAEAIKLGCARAFCLLETESDLPTTDLRKILKAKGYLTQDSRVKERKKYGLKKARKASQYHKR